MSKDRDKLIRILYELENDYISGKLSEEKYIYFYNQYKHKLDTLEVSDRIRTMQGRDNYNSPENYDYGDVSDDYNQDMNQQGYNEYLDESEVFNNSYAEEYPNDDRYDVFDNIDNDASYNNPYYKRNKKNYGSKNRIEDTNSKTGSKGKSRIAVGILLTFVLLFAFGTGIVMGIFNNSGGDLTSVSELLGSGAVINDTSFPVDDSKLNSSSNSSSSNYSSSNYSSSNYHYKSYDYSSGSGSYDSGSYSSDSSGSGSYDSADSSSSSSSSSSSGSYDSGSSQTTNY
ncbi:MAG: hypothetical protein MJ232_05855 [archaeon]|nr:hypothetical protein [archaeon]